MRPSAKIAGAASVALVLTGCDVNSVVPEALLVPAPCPEFPPVGSGDRALGEYILRLDACAVERGAQLEAIAEIVRPR
jgi:hypothetical protein